MGAIVQSTRQPPQAAEAELAEGAQYLTFRLGAELYAIGIGNIKEIIEFGSVTPVPMMPDFIRGVINVRGAVVPVIDLLARFGKSVSQATKRTCIVIVELDCDGETQSVGVMVDAVNEVLEIAAADIEPAPAFGAGLRADFIAGMGKVAGKFIVLLDIGRVLSVDEISMLAQASGQSHAVAAFAGAQAAA
jgi:purine-binding chemotaxis protein CheW